MELNKLVRDPLVQSLFASVLCLVVVAVARSLALRALTRGDLSSEARAMWRAQVRNATVVAVLMGLTIIWAEELRTAAISIVAIAAALVIGTKELIMCLLGGILRASGHGFKIGDRIEVSGVRGDVADVGPLTTSLLEVGPTAATSARTGRVVTLPNSVFLSEKVFNMTQSHAYVFHVLRVPLKAEDDWHAAEQRLLDIGREATSEYLGEARAEMSMVARRRGLDPPRVEPQVYLEIPEPGRVELQFFFPAPARARGDLAQTILRRFLEPA